MAHAPPLLACNGSVTGSGTSASRTSAQLGASRGRLTADPERTSIARTRTAAVSHRRGRRRPYLPSLVCCAAEFHPIDRHCAGIGCEVRQPRRWVLRRITALLGSCLKPCQGGQVDFPSQSPAPDGAGADSIWSARPPCAGTHGFAVTVTMPLSTVGATTVNPASTSLRWTQSLERRSFLYQLLRSAQRRPSQR